MPPGALRVASRVADSSAIVRSRHSAMAAKCRSSAAVSVGSALAARRSGRANTLVGREFKSAAPVSGTAGKCAPIPGPCRKPPSTLYVEHGKEVLTSLPFSFAMDIRKILETFEDIDRLAEAFPLIVDQI
jgi:hypothetical protein